MKILALESSVVILFIFTHFFTTAQAHLFPYEPRDPLSGTPVPLGSIWPKSVLDSTGQTYYSVDTDNFQIEVYQKDSSETLNCETLDWARDHYAQLVRKLKPANSSASNGIKTLRIEIQNCSSGAFPSVDDKWEELYDLEIRRDMFGVVNARLKVNGPFGAIRGLETFYQLLWPENEDETVHNVNETEIIDWPRFTHRGMMLDTARHYLPEKIILQVLTTMMYNKFNVFHWHIVDDQSFPYVSKKFPELSEKGKYNKGAVYTTEAVQRIIEAARVRGIRVILEFDTPGHGGGFGRSHQEILTPCFGDGVNAGTPNHPEHTSYENIDPTNEQSYTFMKEFFTEVVQNVSKDSFIHLGMDEVYYPCWESSPLIKEFMEKNGYENMSQVQGHYTQRHVEMIKSLNVTPISWQDPLDANVDLDKDVVVQVWKDWGEGGWQVAWQNALDRGHKVILSACWYVNYISYGETWRQYYDCDPVLGTNVTESQLPQILGGEVALWAEFVDQTNIVARLFPFSSAVGEVLWTDLDRRETTVDAKWRLDNFRCTLLRRGVRAQPILNGHCGAFEANLEL